MLPNAHGSDDVGQVNKRVGMPLRHPTCAQLSSPAPPVPWVRLVVCWPKMISHVLAQVWPEDLKDGMQEGYGVESVCDVASRVGRLVRSLEVRRRGRNCSPCSVSNRCDGAYILTTLNVCVCVCVCWCV